MDTNRPYFEGDGRETPTMLELIFTPSSGFAAWPDLVDKGMTRLYDEASGMPPILRMAVIGDTGEGDGPSVAFRIDVPGSDKPYILESSAKLFLVAASMIREHFPALDSDAEILRETGLRGPPGKRH